MTAKLKTRRHHNKRTRKTRKIIKPTKRPLSCEDQVQFSLLGKGANGCVYGPDQTCLGSIVADKKKIIKVTYPGESDTEIALARDLALIDADDKYETSHIIDITHSVPHHVRRYMISQCTKLADKEDTHNLMFIQEINGGTPLMKLVRNRAISVQDYPFIFNSLLTGICNIHKAGWAHGDVKAENTIIDFDSITNRVNHARVIDFGLSVKTIDKYDASAFHSIYWFPYHAYSAMQYALSDGHEHHSPDQIKEERYEKIHDIWTDIGTGYSSQLVQVLRDNENWDVVNRVRTLFLQEQEYRRHKVKDIMEQSDFFGFYMMIVYVLASDKDRIRSGLMDYVLDELGQYCRKITASEHIQDLSADIEQRLRDVIAKLN